MKFLIIGTSLNPESHSQLMAEEAFQYMKAKEEVEYLDLRKIRTLPFCHGLKEKKPAFVIELMEKIKKADGIIIATPVYNYSMTGGTKNFVEITQEGWNGKVVGILAAAGGIRSYLAPVPLMNILMLDFKCVIVPNFVHAYGEDFDDNHRMSDGTLKRIKEVAQKVIDFTYALKKGK